MSNCRDISGKTQCQLASSCSYCEYTNSQGDTYGCCVATSSTSGSSCSCGTAAEEILTTAAIIGIVIGCVALVIFLIAGIYYCLCRTKDEK